MKVFGTKKDYTADFRDIYLFYSEKKARLWLQKKHFTNNFIERDTLLLFYYGKEIATCKVQNKDVDLKEILEIKLEILKSKIIEKNKI